MIHSMLVSWNPSYTSAQRGSCTHTGGGWHLVYCIPSHICFLTVQAVLNSGLNEKTDAELINMIGQIIGNLQAEKMVTSAN